MKSTTLVDEGEVFIVRLIAETDVEKDFLAKAYKEGLRVFEITNDGQAIGMILPSSADFKQFHVPTVVVDYINTLLSEGILSFSHEVPTRKTEVFKS